jgi:hypothetical protein
MLHISRSSSVESILFFMFADNFFLCVLNALIKSDKRRYKLGAIQIIHETLQDGGFFDFVTKCHMKGGVGQ